MRRAAIARPHGKDVIVRSDARRSPELMAADRRRSLPGSYAVTTFGPGHDMIEQRTVQFDAKALQAQFDAESPGTHFVLQRATPTELHPLLGGLMLISIFAIATLLIVAAG